MFIKCDSNLECNVPQDFLLLLRICVELGVPGTTIYCTLFLERPEDCSFNRVM